ncbi:MAG: helical backbone metal receptor [Desulfobacteraceae bacterium]
MKPALFIPIVAMAVFFHSPAPLHAGSAGGQPPQKVVSLGPVITEMIYLLKAEERLSGVTSYCRIPPGRAEKEIIGTVMQMNVEKIVHLEPDLVIANTLTRKKQVRILEKQKVKVITLDTPKNFDDICANFARLGNLVGKKARAEKIIQRARRAVAAVREKSRHLDRPRVFIQIGLKPLKTSPADTFIHEYIAFAGGVNIAEGVREGVYSREKVLRENPDVILIATMGSSKTAGLKEKEAWQRFSFLKAVKNRAVYVLDPDIVCSPTPETFARGLSVFFRRLHPGETKEASHG